MSDLIEIYADGACAGNPGPGAYAAVVRLPDGRCYPVTGVDKYTTNNRMELIAAISAIETLTGERSIVLRSDSTYLIQGIDWLNRWELNGWLTHYNRPVANQDLWLRYRRAVASHTVVGEWVRGHASDAEQIEVDRLAKAELKKLLTSCPELLNKKQ